MEVTGSIQIGSESIRTSEPIYIGAECAKQYEAVMKSLAINYRYWRRMQSPIVSNCLFMGTGIPSLLISAEFVSKEPDPLDIVHVDFDTYGAGVAEALGVSVAEPLAQELTRVRGAQNIATYVQAPDTSIRHDDHRLLADKLKEEGVNILHADDIHDTPSDFQTWITGDTGVLRARLMEESVATSKRGKPLRSAIERSVFWPLETGGSSYLQHTGGIRLSEIDSLKELTDRFPMGFVVRHINEEENMIRCTPNPKGDHDEAWYETRVQLKTVFDGPSRALYFAQGLREPDTLKVNLRQPDSAKVRRRKRREHLQLFFLCGQNGMVLLGGYAMSSSSGRPSIENGSILRAAYVEH